MDKLNTVLHTCNTNTWETEAEGSQQNYPGVHIHSDNLSKIISILYNVMKEKVESKFEIKFLTN